MTTVSVPPPGPSVPSPRERAPGRGDRATGPASGLKLFDATLVVLFLAITALMGVFPLKDADNYWHLRTGDLIRRTGQIPRADFYTFTREGATWIDLHWLFQVGMSWINERAGVPGLILAKVLITTVAVALLVTARRRSWPIWAMLLAWLPALVVLSGRMYVRPETLSLLYLAVYLAVLCRWDRLPLLAWVLPFVQVAWVNSQGLFVLGPVLLVCGLIDALLRPRSLTQEPSRWWKTVAPACAAVLLACLFNPYGLRGATYPLELARTMSNPIFSNKIAELTPIPRFIEHSGLTSVPLLIQLGTLVLGAVSFVVPLGWAISRRMLQPRAGRDAAPEGKPEKKRVSKKKPPAREEEEGWRLSPLRVLLFTAFSVLSFQATRNSHQFAAVAGTITAWNIGEWIAAMRRARGQAAEDAGAAALRPRLFTLATLLLMLIAVGSGRYFDFLGEGRQIGWGEDPLWYPHEAAKFAGKEGMPSRFIGIHIGQASLLEYYNSPERPGGPGKLAYTDPRLEVMGAELFDEYDRLSSRLVLDKPGWESELQRLGLPSILVDHEYDSLTGATLLASPRWRCVWFDAVAALYVHESYANIVRSSEVDFGDRHFHPRADTEPHGPAELKALARATRYYSGALAGRSRSSAALGWLAMDAARRMLALEANSLEAWKTLGQVQIREPSDPPSPRYRQRFDPVFDLGMVRASYALRRAIAAAPSDFSSLYSLVGINANRQMNESLLPTLDQMLAIVPINPDQRKALAIAGPMRDEIRRKLERAPETKWKNVGDLERIVGDLLADGRVKTACEVLEQAYPLEKAPWEVVARMATMRLHMGEPSEARRLLLAATTVPSSAIRDARVAAADLAEEKLDDARAAYERAIAADPGLFEARYGLAVLEQDAGRATQALTQAEAAVGCSPNDVSRFAAKAIADAVRRYADPAAETQAVPAAEGRR